MIVTKVCGLCKIEKTRDQFWKETRCKDGLGFRCIPCQKQYSKVVRTKERSRSYKKKYNASRNGSLQNFRYRLNKKYGISIEQYERMFNDQNGRCPICLDSFPALVVDHDHSTSRIRGLLCVSCNLLLGHARDRANLLINAANYLTLG